MATQTQKGKAFEYACLNALKQHLHYSQEIIIEDSEALATARDFYGNIDAESRGQMDQAALAAARIIARLEPKLEDTGGNSPLYMAIQEDSKGIAGDVRDVVCMRKQDGWEIGLSCKHNHTALKHSRLSNTIDFGKMWFDKACSKEYFDTIAPIFSMLKEYKDRHVKWRELDDKEESVYIPLLEAFMKELRRLEQEYPEEIPAELVRYLLGRSDFYKVITNDARKLTTIQAYNLFGTLNQSSKSARPLNKVHCLQLPTKFYDISYKKNSNNTVIVTCDGGWAFSFRIHNASTNVEPSLKFDVQIVGMPPQLHAQVEPWKEIPCEEMNISGEEINKQGAKIREITENDFGGLMELYMQLNDTCQPEKSEGIMEIWEQILNDENHHIIVAVEDGKIVSSCVCVIIPNLTHVRRPYAFVENVITDEAYRNKGLATQCLNYAKELALKADCCKLMLMDGANMESIIHFYEQAGYSKDDTMAFIQWI